MKSSSEYMKELGRDGAYVEYDARQLQGLFALAKSEEFPKLITLTSARLELSDPTHIINLRKAMLWLEQSGEVKGMDDEQKSFYLFRRIFEEGLRSLVEDLPYLKELQEDPPYQKDLKEISE